MSPDLRRSRLARAGAATIATGFLLFLFGVFPEPVGLGLTPGIGIFQIFTFLLGLAVMTLGAYIYAYATRHRAMAPRLREDVGVRLMATGLVIAWTCGFADLLGIGSHFGLERPLFGPFQALGVTVGVIVSILGLFLYSMRSRD